MTQHAIQQIVTALSTVLAISVLLPQCRRPRWLPGRLIARMMNLSHAGLTSWGLKHVAIAPGDTILDIGCGGGRTVRTLATAAPHGKVVGVDYSAASVAVSRKTNAELIAAGRVEIREATVSQLPFPDATFDVVTAIETHYYWPDPVSDFREVLRVLKPGGKFVIIAEVYKHGTRDYVHPLAMRVVGGAARTISEQTEQLESAGYVATEAHADPANGWLCVVTAKPGTA